MSLIWWILQILVQLKLKMKIYPFDLSNQEQNKKYIRGWDVSLIVAYGQEELEKKKNRCVW